VTDFITSSPTDEFPYVAFSGTRESLTDNEFARVFDVVKALGKHCIYVTGACTGVDATVARIAFTEGYTVHTVIPIQAHPRYFDTHWRAYSTTSEMVNTFADRNRRMVELANPDIGLFAFPSHAEDDPRSRRSGTWQTIRMARKAGKRVQVIVLDAAEVQR
jgi:predicted Rossmann fold nucleotide-binding protein DprA/Smf involved in DNA uptake